MVCNSSDKMRMCPNGPYISGTNRSQDLRLRGLGSLRLTNSAAGVSSRATPVNFRETSPMLRLRSPTAGSWIRTFRPLTRSKTTKWLNPQCKIAGVFNSPSSSSSHRTALPTRPMSAATSFTSLSVMPREETWYFCRNEDRSSLEPNRSAAMARQASPHSEVSVWRMENPLLQVRTSSGLLL